MTSEVVLDGDLVSRWVMQRVGGTWIAGLYRGIGLVEQGEMVAGAAFEGYNGNNILVHIAIERPSATMLLFKLIARYSFGQLELPRLTLVADSSNIAAVKLHQRLGAVLEGRLVGAGKCGDDILLSRLSADCRLWRRWNGKQTKLGTPAARLRKPDPAAGSLELTTVRDDARRQPG